MVVDTDHFSKLDINIVSYQQPTTKRKKIKQVWQPKAEREQESKEYIKRTLVFERLQLPLSTRGIWVPHQIRQSVIDQLEPQIEGTSSGLTYLIIGPQLVDIQQAMKRQEKTLKFKKPKQQIHGEIEVA